MRVKITLACSECKQRNYNTMKNKKNDPDRLEMNKYCRFCKKHTLHKETKERGGQVMAKELDTAKNSPENEKEKTEKKSKDAKASKDKIAKNGKKKKGIKKYFKDAKAEFKKVVWPTPKDTTRNTIVVIIMCVIAGAVIFGLDSLFGLLNKLAFH